MALGRGLLTLAAAVALVGASPPTIAAPPACDRLVPHIETAAREHGVDAALLAGIIAVESGFRTDVTSRSGARGPMQIMPSTGRAMRCGALDVPATNIACGARLLARHLDHYDGRVLYALAAYRLGRRDPDRAFGARRPVAMTYVEKVVRARARFLARGCAAWSRP
ncbi:MAG: transglycosylase SLT domain-containing protein [Deltaproteobacteria bacterium]|nr:transglycosylase SLT domain-containing protein [Deltaproteobacteria bacterium]